MPLLNFLTQRKSSAHRIAGKALFRALLLQSRASGLEPAQIQEIQNVVRNRYKENVHNTSSIAIPLLFRAGYQAIDHLDAAVAGDETSRQYLRTLLEDIPAKAKRPPPRKAAPIRAVKKVEPRDDERSIFNRPRPLSELSGRRHIPRMISAGNLPVLRIKKPQPPMLGAFIRHRTKQREARHRLKGSLEEQIDAAALEDEWDDILEQDHDVVKDDCNGDSRRAPRWTTTLQAARQQVQQYIDGETQRNTETAARYQQIIHQERALAKQEWEERKRQKRQLGSKQTQSTPQVPSMLTVKGMQSMLR